MDSLFRCLAPLNTVNDVQISHAEPSYCLVLELAYQAIFHFASLFALSQVEFLCDRGADVNRGQRSSSLHYAACFGRPLVVKTLLLHKADCSLRDEEGKTALEKAKERNDEGHREVVKLLENPGSSHFHLQPIKFDCAPVIVK